jgi:hypothetical protein
VLGTRGVARRDDRRRDAGVAAMRAFALHDDRLQLGLADVGPEHEPAVRDLYFERRGAVFVRSFAGGAPHAAQAAARFEQVAEAMVLQAGGLEPARWEEALTALIEHAGTALWWLVGSTALAVRGVAVEPRDVDVITTADACPTVAEALADVLVEPLSDGGSLGQYWFRAFAGARIECVGGVHDRVAPDVSVPETELEHVEWRGHVLRVPPLQLQLQGAEARGLAQRVALIREAL